MEFSRLRLTGFKSFVDPTDLYIDPGLTGVVGPNGCGKSNIVEALRWVMGENAPRQMRSAEMDEVIFAGTAGRPARNMAEVLLTLDNAGRDAPAAYNEGPEINVARRIERGSGSQFRVNGRDVRARDVQTLFADLASGSRTTAIVNQGQIGDLVSARPADRRRVLEDAAGITGLHARRHEAELRLRAAETNLERLEDVVGALEEQHRGLKRQARQATRYRNLSDRIKRAEGALLHRRWMAATQAMADAREALSLAEDARGRGHRRGFARHRFPRDGGGGDPAAARGGAAGGGFAQDAAGQARRAGAGGAPRGPGGRGAGAPHPPARRRRRGRAGPPFGRRAGPRPAGLGDGRHRRRRGGPRGAAWPGSPTGWPRRGGRTTPPNRRMPRRSRISPRPMRGAARWSSGSRKPGRGGTGSPRAAASSPRTRRSATRWTDSKARWPRPRRRPPPPSPGWRKRRPPLRAPRRTRPRRAADEAARLALRAAETDSDRAKSEIDALAGCSISGSRGSGRR